MTMNTWPRDQYTGQGGGLFTGQCDNPYRSNIPPWHIFVEELEKRNMNNYVDIIRRAFKAVGIDLEYIVVLCSVLPFKKSMILNR